MDQTNQTTLQREIAAMSPQAAAKLAREFQSAVEIYDLLDCAEFRLIKWLYIKLQTEGTPDEFPHVGVVVTEVKK